MKEKDVKYERLVVDDLPERPPRGSQLEDALKEIQADSSLNGKYVCIAQYAQPTAATAAANICRKRHGKPEAYGWWFGTRKVTVDGEERTGLFVGFDPGRIKDGEAAKFETEKAAYLARQKQKRDEKAAEAKAAKGKSPAKARA